MKKKFYKHPSSIVETDKIGDETKIWAFTHILPNVSIGTNCNICDNVFIEKNVIIGNGVTIKNGVSIWEGVTVEDNVFIGPNAVFTNDKFPRSARSATAIRHYKNKVWLEPTSLQYGCSIGANATILCGISIGKFAMVGAGAVVRCCVDDFSIVAGIPAQPIGYACRCGKRVDNPGDHCSEDCFFNHQNTAIP